MGYTNEIEKAILKDAKEKRYPVKVNLELLPICNLNCKMCYIRSTPEQVNAKGGLRTVEEWLAIAEELLKANTLFLLLTGGEVFLYPRFRELYEALYDMGFSITINTNATMIDENEIAFLAERPPKCVSISLYGSNNRVYRDICGIDGMFTRVDRAITLLQEQNIKLELKTVATPINKDDIMNCRAYATARNIPYETAYYAYPPVRKLMAEEQLRLTPIEAARCRFAENMGYADEESNLNAIRKYMDDYETCRQRPGTELCGLHCSAASSSCWITWEGKMVSCAMLPEPYTLPFQDGFLPAWEKLKAECDKIHMSSKCSHCDKRTICGVCPAANYTETGSYEKSSPFHCRMVEETLELMEKYLAEHSPKGEDGYSKRGE